MKRFLFFVLLGCFGGMAAEPLRAEDPPGFHRMKVGETAPEFKLPGIDGRDWTLADFKDAEVLMVYFTSNHCPVCHAQDPRLMTLVRELKGRSFAVVGINPNSPDGLRLDELGYSKYDDSFEDMKALRPGRRFHVSVSLRRSHAEYRQGLRLPGDAPCVRFRQGAEAAVSGLAG